jgi:hypothetical protein
MVNTKNDEEIEYSPIWTGPIHPEILYDHVSWNSCCLKLHFLISIIQRMPSSAIVHAAVFTAGALLGGGIAAAVSSRQKLTPAYVKSPAQVVGIDITGTTRTSPELSVSHVLSSPLKYGNPGAFMSRLCHA